MNLRRSTSILTALAFAVLAQPASAQVIIDFGKVKDLPFSPWAMAALGILVALAGLFFIKRKAGYGAFLLVLTSGLLVTTVMQEKDSHAVIAPTLVPMRTSGVPITPAYLAAKMLAPSCGPTAYNSQIGYVWVTSGVGKIAITGIRFEPGYGPFDPNNPPEPTIPSPLASAPAPACHVGDLLDGNHSCVVWFQLPIRCG